MTYLLILLLLIPNIASACESYEECMKLGSCGDAIYGNGVRYCSDEIGVINSNKAIAYALKEISEKLDK